jgi:hypothetical protein
VDATIPTWAAGIGGKLVAAPLVKLLYVKVSPKGSGGIRICPATGLSTAKFSNGSFKSAPERFFPLVEMTSRCSVRSLS